MPKGSEHSDAELTDLVDQQGGGSGHSSATSMDQDTLQSLEDAAKGKELLKTIDTVVAPPHFERRVQFKVRRRSAGRYFSAHPPVQSFLVSIDAFIVLAVAIMAACWFLVQEPPNTDKTFFNDPPGQDTPLTKPPASLAP